MIDKWNHIHHLSKSPDERYIAVASRDDIAIYETGTKKLLTNLLNAQRKSKNSPKTIVVETSSAVPVKTQACSTPVKKQLSKCLQLQQAIQSACVIS